MTLQTKSSVKCTMTVVLLFMAAIQAKPAIVVPELKVGTLGVPKFVEPTVWGPETNGFRLALIIKTNFIVGEPVMLQLTLQNVGHVVREVSQTSPERDFDVIIRDEQGDVVPLTEWGKKFKNDIDRMWNNVLHVKPGEEVNVLLRIDGIWDLSHPGKYQVTGERKLPLPNSRALRAQGREEWKTLIPVFSNTVEINLSKPAERSTR